MSDDAIESALDVLKDKGPEFGPGLSNHGPMAAEALVAMGRGEEAERWAAWYAGNLSAGPDARSPIARDDWREALGDIGRVGDWSAYFARALGEAPWPDVLPLWVGRLAPGIMAGATHGILRTAHAVRSLERGASAARVRELGEGLAYWAARYQELPTSRGRGGTKDIADAVREVPRVEPQPGRSLIFEAVKRVDPEPFAQAVNLVSVERVDLDAVISDITRTFVRWYLPNAGHAAIAFVHTVTAPSALRILAPHLDEAGARDATWYAWQACAAIYATYARSGPTSDVREGGAGFDAADLVEQAVTARDEHAIKFTEACLREHRITGDPAFVAAARDAVQRLRVRS